MEENPACERCELHTTAGKRSVCLKGRGGDIATVAIFLDAPNELEDRRGRGCVSDGVEWLMWAFQRMSIPAEQFYIDYIIKCCPKRNRNYGKKAYRQVMTEACSYYRFATVAILKPKAIIAMGGKACEAFVGQDRVSAYEGASWTPLEPEIREVVPCVWVTYSPAYSLQDPAESVSIFRTLWFAVMSTGLVPKIADIPPFDYGT